MAKKQKPSSRTINLNAPSAQEEVFASPKKRWDVTSSSPLSRQVVFAKVSQFFRDRSREVGQFGGILVLLFVIMLSLFLTREAFRVKYEVSAEFSSAYSYILDAEQRVRSLDFSGARTRIGEADLELSELEETLEVLGFLNASLLAMDGSTGSLQDLLAGSRALGEGFTQLLHVLENVQDFQERFTTMSLEEFQVYYPSLTEFLGVQFAHARAAQEYLANGQALLASVDTTLLPWELEDRLHTLQERLITVSTMIDTVLALEPVIFDVLGERYPRTYVILLQNASEMRPTGGFLGSMIFVTFNDGWLTELRFVDVYDIAGQIVSSILAPPGLDTLTNRFGLQDANYFPDFPETAQNILWFLDQGKVPTVDGVIAVNTSLVRELLAHTGPIAIETPEGVQGVGSEDFEAMLSLMVEGKVDAVAPKEILGHFIEGVKEALPSLAMEDALSLVDYVYTHRSVALYARSEVVQEFITAQGLDGAMPIPAAKQDLLMVVPTSISANKSDQYVTQRVKHETEFLEGGMALNRVTIRRTHLWSDARQEALEVLAQRIGVPLTEELQFIMGNGLNRQYVRVYVPRGAQLLMQEEGGYEVTEEGPYTIFSFVMEVAPGDTTEHILVYKLPYVYEAVDRYSLLVQKSVGDFDSYFQKTFLNFNHVVTTSFSSRGERGGEGSLVFADTLEDSLEYFALLRF